MLDLVSRIRAERRLYYTGSSRSITGVSNCLYLSGQTNFNYETTRHTECNDNAGLALISSVLS